MGKKVTNFDFLPFLLKAENFMEQIQEYFKLWL